MSSALSLECTATLAYGNYIHHRYDKNASRCADAYEYANLICQRPVQHPSAEVLIIARRTQCEEHIMALHCGEPVAIDTVVLPLSIQNDTVRSLTLASEGHMSLKRAWIMPQVARQLKNVIITNYDANKS